MTKKIKEKEKKSRRTNVCITLQNAPNIFGDGKKRGGREGLLWLLVVHEALQILKKLKQAR